MAYINLPSGQTIDVKRKSDQKVFKGLTGYDPDSYDPVGSSYGYGTISLTTPKQLKAIEESLAKIKASIAAATKGTEELVVRKKAGEVITPQTVLTSITSEQLRGEVPLPDLSKLPPADTKGIDTAYTNATSTSQLLQQQLAQQQKEREEMEKSLAGAGATGATLWQKMLSLAGQKPTVEAQKTLAEQQAKYEVPEWLEKVQAQNVKVAQIQGDITKLDVQRQTEIDRAYTLGMPMAYIQSNINEIDRVRNSKKAYKVAEMSAEAALMQAYQGNLSEARGLVADAVNAYTYDIQQQRSDFDYVFNVYGDWINGLEAKDRQILEDTRADLIRQEEITRTEKTNLMNLMLQYPEAGITITDTLERATEKARAAIVATPDLLSISEAKSLGVPYGTTRQQALGITPPSGEGITGFTAQEQRKLEQAGLMNASRGEQLDYLYGKGIAEEEIYLTESNYTDIAKSLVSSYGNAGDAKNAVNIGVIKINEKKVNLTSEQIQNIKNKIDSLYPSGELPPSAWQKVKDWWSGLWK